MLSKMPVRHEDFVKERNVSEDFHVGGAFQDMTAGRVPYEYFDFLRRFAVFSVFLFVCAEVLFSLYYFLHH